MTKEELRKEAEEWLSITDNHLNDERTHFLSESEYAEQAYLAGAEPREKRIEELEEKIKSLEGNSSLHEGILWNDIHNQDKKIAELKARLKEHESIGNAQFWENVWSWKTKAEQLTKAKELLKELSKSLFLAKGIVRDLIDDTVDFKESKERASYCYEQESFDTYKKAEQFLNSEVEK